MSQHYLEPVKTPETQPYWKALANGQLQLPRCNDCQQFYFPPGNVCIHCTSDNICWQATSGKAFLYSYVINHRPDPVWDSGEAMSVALVELEEGPRVIATVVNCPQTPEALVLDMPLQAVFDRRIGDTTMLCFEPVNPAEGESA